MKLFATPHTGESENGDVGAFGGGDRLKNEAGLKKEPNKLLLVIQSVP